MAYLELLEKFEKEVLGGKIVAKRHDAREDFAMWLDKQAAQHSVQRTADNVAQNDPFKTVSISGKPKRALDGANVPNVGVMRQQREQVGDVGPAKSPRK